MKAWMHNLYMKQVRMAIETYDLIAPGDKILVGVSGGKDSSLLLYALSQLSRLKIYDFTVAGLTVDHGMLGEMPAYEAFCKAHDLPIHIHHEHYAEQLSFENPHNPCYTCSRLRKGIVKRYALENGFNKIAFGHTKEDVVETFLMNVLKHGKMATMPPKDLDEESGITLIRPLIFVDEKAITKAVQILEVPLMRDLCTFASNRVRSDAEALIGHIEGHAPTFSDQVIKALQNVEMNRLLGIEKR